jgi:hypothetical protein
MRTTMTLQPDVAEKLRDEMGRTGESFKDTVNRVLRDGLALRSRPPRRPFVIVPRRLGLHPGVDIDNVAELLERLEGPDFR